MSSSAEASGAEGAEGAEGVEAIALSSLERTRALFASSASGPAETGPEPHRQAQRARYEYGAEAASRAAVNPPLASRKRARKEREEEKVLVEDDADSSDGRKEEEEDDDDDDARAMPPPAAPAPLRERTRAVILARKAQRAAPPAWHAPWKLMRVVPGHLGWVRSVAVDPSNEWFVTGSVDRTIKVWDLASGQLRVTLTGHISAVRGLAVSARRPYLFSAGEDKTVRCWDLEHNKVIRRYTGHLSGVYSLALHPTLDVLVSGGRDSTARVWDMRTSKEVMMLGGHTQTVGAVLAQATDPQVVTGSYDSTVRLWDLAAGGRVVPGAAATGGARLRAALTHHKKGVRALVAHPTEYSFCSAAADNLKVWGLPDGRFQRNMRGHDGSTLVNAACLNRDGVLAAGGDDGTLWFRDWKTGHCFQRLRSRGQSGTLDAERSVLAATYDVTGSRLITCEGDKTVKVWREDPDATPETHPVVFD